MKKGNNRDGRQRKRIVQRNVKYINARARYARSWLSARFTSRPCQRVRVCRMYQYYLSLFLCAFRVQYGIAAVNSIFACTAPERAPIARSRMVVHEKWPSRTVIITRVMIRIYVLIRRNGCTLIIPVQSTWIISCLFDAFHSSHSKRYVAPTISLYVFVFFSSSLLATFPFHPAWYCGVPTSRLQSSVDIFHFARSPVPTSPSPRRAL